MISLLAPEDHEPGHPRLATAGRISFGWEVRIVDPAGREVPGDTAGELLIRGECLFAGYWRDPDATAAAFADGGWYRTGDVASLSADGYLTILDRAKDMIISGGENIYPAEVEAVLAAHPEVADVAVVGRPDRTWGEAVHAVIIPADGAAAAPEEIIDWCRHRLAHFKCPKTAEFTASLPRTTTGKVLKRELRAQLAARRRRGPPSSPRRRCRESPLGLSVASHSGLAAGPVGELAASAEAAGFSAVFVAEGHGDALSLCHPVIAATRRVRVGTAIANAALRPPVLAAKTAAQLDQASGGRFLLGLGVANEVMNSRFGLPPFRPLGMIGEYTAVVRAVLAGQPHDGALFRTGLVPLDSPPVRTALPVYLAALSPRMLALAGQIADGVILNLMSPAQAAEAARLVREAAAAPAGTRRASRSCAWCTPACPMTGRRPPRPPARSFRGTCCIRRRRACSARPP